MPTRKGENAMTHIRTCPAWALVLAALAATLLAADRGFSAESPAEKGKHVSTETVPELVDEVGMASTAPNQGPLVCHAEGVFYANRKSIEEIRGMNSPATRLELAKRLADETLPLHLRCFYAALLTELHDDRGPTFFQKVATNPKTRDLDDVCWIIGHMCSRNRAAMEDLMIQLLADKRLVEYPPGSYGPNCKLQMQVLAVRESGIPETLAAMKSRKAVPVLIELAGWPEVMRALGKLRDPRAVPTLLKILDSKEAGFINDPAEKAALILARMRCKEAVPILLKRIDRDGYIYAIEKLCNKEDVPALRAKLPQLNEEKQRELKLALLTLEGGDPVPQLLKYAEEWGFSEHNVAWGRLCEMKDPRTVPLAVNVLRKHPSVYARHEALWLLRDVARSVAVEGLIDSLDADFSKLPKEHGKGEFNDWEKEFPAEIAGILQAYTNHDFGIDQKAWKNWWEKNKATWRLPPDVQAEVELTALMRTKPADLVSQLLKYTQHPNPDIRDRAANFLWQQRDPRAVPLAVKRMREQPDGYERLWAIDFLKEQATAEAIEGLIDGLGADFSSAQGVNDEGGPENWPKRCRAEIVAALRTIAKQELGPDQKVWRQWWNQHKAGWQPPKLTPRDDEND
jgi:HEAT repeat protein